MKMDDIKIKINNSTVQSRIIAELCSDGFRELASKICKEKRKMILDKGL